MRPMTLIVFPLITFIMSGLIYVNYINNTQTVQLFALPSWICSFIPNAESISSTCTNTTIDPMFFFSIFTTPSGLLFIGSIISGVILIILSSGLTVSIQGLSFGGSLGINDAGTKFYRNMGLGLLVWAFAEIIEGGWCDILPNGFSGVICLVLEVIFIIGVWQQSESWI